MRHLLRGQKDARDVEESFEVWGIKAPEGAVPSRDFELWAENWPALDIFTELQTQWNYSNAGAVGLRYDAVPLLLRLHGIPRKDWRDVFDGIRNAEREALRIWREG